MHEEYMIDLNINTFLYRAPPPFHRFQLCCEMRLIVYGEGVAYHTVVQYTKEGTVVSTTARNKILRN